MYDKNDNLKDLHFRILVTEAIYQSDKFLVYTYEAGSKKTRTMINALIDLYKVNPKQKTLIVTKLKKEQKELEKGLGEIALVVNSEEKVDEKVLFKATVLIITHDLYRRLCMDYERRQYYIDGRNTLIIDEQLNLSKVEIATTTRAEEIQAELKSIIIYDENKKQIALEELWGDIVLGLNNAINNAYSNRKMKFINIENDKIDNQLEVLTKRIKGSRISESRKKDLISKINYCKYFYNNEEVIAKDAKLLTYNKAVDYFMLENNIMLDASGKFLELYKISDKFKVIDSERITEHSNTDLVFIEENSTTSHITKNVKRYFENLTDYIKKHTKDGDKVLIVGRETINDNGKDVNTTELINSLFQIKGIEFEFVNFDAMRGKNDWKDYNKCFVIHFPNDVFHNYVFQYLQYRKITKLPLVNDDLVINKIKGSKQHGFCNNEDLEKMRITDVVSNIYQALKRVNRMDVTNNESTFYVVTNEKRVQDLLIEQFKGLREVKYEPISDSTIAKIVKKSKEVKSHFLSMEIGCKITKKKLRATYDIGTTEEFSRILKKLGGKQFLDDVGIEEVGNSYMRVEKVERVA